MQSSIIAGGDASYFLSSIIDTLQDSVVTIDLYGKVTSWNPSAEKLYGYPSKEAIGQSLELILKPGDFSPLLEKIDAIRKGLAVPVYDTFRLRKDRREINLEITLSPVLNSTGDIIGISTLARDVTKVRQSEESRLKSENHLRAILESAKDFAVISLDGGGIITDWNSGAENIFGYTKQEAIGQHTSLIFTPEDRHGKMAEVEINTARQTGRSIDERWHMHKDGSRFFMSGVMTPINEHPSGALVKVARNITDRKLAEEAMMISEQKSSLAALSAGMGEWDWDLVNETVTVSSQTRVLLGVAENGGDSVDNLLMAVVYPLDKDRVTLELEKAMNGLFIFQSDFRIIRQDTSEIRWVNVYGRIVAHANEHPSRMIGVIYDITNRMLLEKQKDDFISLASHELKTPVTAIKGFSDLLASRFETNTKQQNFDLLRRLNNQVDRLTRLIQTMLDSSNLAEGKMQISAKPLDLHDLISEHITNYQLTTSTHILTTELSPVAIVHADSERILQVVSNFVSNAIKYSPPGSTITVSVTDGLDSARVAVKDNGPGIASDVQPFLFDRYYRVPADGNSSREGFGLGLYISAEIIREHYGHIGVESTSGQGSTFFFTLPYS
ncbi:MAG: PAS domain-containing sensor histidine kinase [Chitinophagaceae bacterium]|nr:MAG: PAS domain-containing sensor histidine kinase [Chitinophagaceae bacterium]